MSKLTRAGARDLTAAIDRVASAVQANHALLGVDSKIAMDFAYRCDLISDAIETTAVSNFPKQAEEVAEDIGEVKPGPIEDGEVEHDADGHFTQEEFSQLTSVAEKLASVLNELSESKTASPKKSVFSHGFDLTK